MTATAPPPILKVTVDEHVQSEVMGRTIKSVADVRRLPVGTRLRLVRSLLGPCRKLRTIVEVRSRDVVMRVDDPADRNYGGHSYLTFPKGTRVEPRIGGFAIIIDGEIANEYYFVHPAEVLERPTYCNDGAMHESWNLADFAEANAEDPEVGPMIGQIRTLGVGESLCLGGGATPRTCITRLT